MKALEKFLTSNFREHIEKCLAKLDLRESPWLLHPFGCNNAH